MKINDDGLFWHGFRGFHGFLFSSIMEAGGRRGKDEGGGMKRTQNTDPHSSLIEASRYGFTKYVLG